MKGQNMAEQSSDLVFRVYGVAEHAISRYARGLLTVDELAARMIQEWQRLSGGEEEPSIKLLTRIAQRLCSRELYASWRSSESERRNHALDNLRRYLACSLEHTPYAKMLFQSANAAEDVLNQTLADMHIALSCNPSFGPDDPAAFLKWTQTILIRHAYAFLQKYKREACLSLEAQLESGSDQIIDQKNDDPQTYVLQRELHRVLKNAILSLRNRRYQEVLIYTYLVGMDDRQLACRWGVEVQDIYLWRHRALKALRSKPEVMQALELWLR